MPILTATTASTPTLLMRNGHLCSTCCRQSGEYEAEVCINLASPGYWPRVVYSGPSDTGCSVNHPYGFKYLTNPYLWHYAILTFIEDTTVDDNIVVGEAQTPLGACIYQSLITLPAGTAITGVLAPGASCRVDVVDYWKVVWGIGYKAGYGGTGGIACWKQV